MAIIPANDNAAEAVLDYHSPVYPTSGRALVGYFKIVYDWKSQSWDPSRGENDLLMITLPSKSFCSIIPPMEFGFSYCLFFFLALIVHFPIPQFSA